MNQIATLSKSMNVTENDLKGFLVCLKHWMDKGLTFEEAVEKNMEVMTAMAGRSSRLSQETVVTITTNAMY